jgi:hypothetical protein
MRVDLPLPLNQHMPLCCAARPACCIALPPAWLAAHSHGALPPPIPCRCRRRPSGSVTKMTIRASSWGACQRRTLAASLKRCGLGVPTAMPAGLNTVHHDSLAAGPAIALRHSEYCVRQYTDVLARRLPRPAPLSRRAAR